MTADRTARLAAIRELHAKATPGEWFFDGEPHNIIIWSDGENRVCFMTSNGPAEENAAFIVNARTDIPFLLTDNARLEAELAASEARVREARKAGIEEAAMYCRRKAEKFATEAASWSETNNDGNAASALTDADYWDVAGRHIHALAQEGETK